MTISVPTAPMNPSLHSIGRAYVPVYGAATRSKATEAARARGVGFVVFSYVLMGLVAVVVLPLAGKLIACLGLLGYAVSIALRSTSPKTTGHQADLRRPV